MAHAPLAETGAWPASFEVCVTCAGLPGGIGLDGWAALKSSCEAVPRKVLSVLTDNFRFDPAPLLAL